MGTMSKFIVSYSPLFLGVILKEMENSFSDFLSSIFLFSYNMGMKSITYS